MKKEHFFILFMFFTTANAQNLEEMKMAKPVKIKGNIGLRGIYMNSGNGLKGGQPFSGMLTGNPVISIYGVEFPFSFVLSSKQTSFQQPFNQYGTSPNYKWATLHLGHRNLNYNNFTLGGRTFYGVGFELTPQKWRIGFIYGRLAKATVIDTFSQTLQSVSFTRKGMAFKVGYGNSKNFIELSGLSAADDSSSLNTNLRELNARYGQNLAPQGNFVTGINSGIQLAKNLSADLQCGLSIFTRDLRNSSFIGNPEHKLYGKWIYLNQTTEYHKALQTGIAYRLKNVGLQLRFLRIEPEYQSMGAYFLNSDVQNITLSPSLSLLNRKILLSGSAGIQKDNLNGLKRTTAKRFISNINLNAQLSKQLTLSATYSNYNLNQLPNVSRIADTFRITQSTQNLSVNPFYSLVSKTKIKTVFVSFNYNQLNDLNTTYSKNYQNRTLNLASVILNYKIKSILKKTGLSFGVNQNRIKSNSIKETTTGGTFGVDKSFRNNKTALSFTNTLLLGKRNNHNTSIVNSGFMASYKIRKHLFSFGSFLNYSHLQSRTKDIIYLRADLSYNFNF